MLGRRGRSDAPPSPSPRPELGAVRASRPAVRISRMRAPSTADGRITAFNTPSIPQGEVPQALANSDRPPVTRTRSLSAPTPYLPGQEGPPGSSHSPAPNTLLEVGRDSRGQPQITVMPPSADFHPGPLSTVPIPPSDGRRATLAANTGFEDNSNRWSWLPSIVRKKSARDMDAESSRARLEGSVRSHDYASSEDRASHHQYADDVVDWLDVIDPQVATVSTLSNVQNSLFVPDIGLINRLPLINLTRNCDECDARSAARTAARTPEVPHANVPESIAEEPKDVLGVEEEARETDRRRKEKGKKHRHRHVPKPVGSHQDEGAYQGENGINGDRQGSPSSEFMSSQSSLDSDTVMRRRERLMRSTETIRGEYAVLPAGIAWDDWTEEEREDLDDYVRHLLHSRRERIRRRFRGFIQFVSRPLGAFITIYAILITFWGSAWVFFLIGWITVGGRRDYFINICEEILTALFCLVGIGMSPFRAVDTYHMIYIIHYHRVTLKLRKQRNLPKLTDKNDLPNPDSLDPDLEAQFAKNEEPVLSPEQQAKLVHHQDKYRRSHTFYRPHETPTHHAFPLSLLIAITVLLDCHSLFQMALGATTWGISYHVRPPELTAIILSFSLSCNITAGILIGVGGRRTRKVEEVEKRLRQALTEEAMRNLGKGKSTRARRRARESEDEPSAKDQGAIDRVKSKVDEIKERHVERRTSEDSQNESLNDRRARWAARAEASTGRRSSRKPHGTNLSSPARTPLGTGGMTPASGSSLSRAVSDSGGQS